MAVVKDSVFFVKKSYKPGKASYEGEVLTFGVDAFASIDDAVAKIEGAGTLVLLDSSVAILNPLPKKVVELVSFYGDDTYFTSKGTLKISADIAGADIKYFNSVTVTDAEVTGNAFGGSISEKTKVKSARGTYTLKNSVVNGNINDFKTVSATNSVINGVLFGNSAKAESAFTFKLDKTAAAGKQYYVGDVQNTDRDLLSYFKSVTVSGIVNKTLSVGVYIYGNIIGCSSFDKKGKFVVSGTLKASAETVIHGDVSLFSSVTLTNSSVKGDIIGNIEAEKASGTFTLKTTAAAVAKGYETGAIRGFKTVKVSGYTNKTVSVKAEVNGDVSGGDYINGKYGANGTASFSAGVEVDGTVSGFKTVTLSMASVGGVDCLNSKGSALNLTNSFVEGDVEGAQKVNVKKGRAVFESYTGTEFDDTLTIAKNSSLTVSEGIDFGAGTKDKFALNGTLVVADKKFVVSGLETLSGSGEIAAASAILDEVKNKFVLPPKSKIKFVALGATSENFFGTQYEVGDDTEKKAYKWENTAFDYNGWLSNSGADIKDEVDYFKLTAPVEVGTVFEFTADNDKVILTYNNVAYRNGDKIVMADSNIFKVSFAEENVGSVAYSLEIA